MAVSLLDCVWFLLPSTCSFTLYDERLIEIRQKIALKAQMSHVYATYDINVYYRISKEPINFAKY